MPGQDVIAFGDGHPGTEALAAAVRTGARTPLSVRLRLTIAALSRIPAIGRLERPRLVRAIDTLDRIMQHAIDASGIRFRLVGGAKGTAVRGSRVRGDRRRNAAAAQHLLVAQAGLGPTEGDAADLVGREARSGGPAAAAGETQPSGALMAATDTLPRGEIRAGARRWSAGRVGEPAAERLSSTLLSDGPTPGRLERGTPHPLGRTSIAPPGSEGHPETSGRPASFLLTECIHGKQANRRIKRTGDRTPHLIRDRLRLSAENGPSRAIEGCYRPYLEEEIGRFAEAPGLLPAGQIEPISGDEEPRRWASGRASMRSRCLPNPVPTPCPIGRGR